MPDVLPWLKLWVDMPMDIKIRQLDAIEKWIWTALMCMTRRSPKAPAIWTHELDEKGRPKEDTELKPATIQDITKIAKVGDEYWLGKHELKFQGTFRELYTKKEFLIYLALEHFKLLDMVTENSRKVFTLKNFTRRQFFQTDPELDISETGRKRIKKIEKTKRIKKNRKGPGSGKPRTEEGLAIYEVYEHWLAVMEKPRAYLTDARKTKIFARLKEGYSVQDLKDAIDGCKSSEWHMGENDRGTVYNDLELIVRNGSKVEAFMARLQKKSGGLKHVHGKPSNRFVDPKDQGAQTNDAEAERRLEELSAFGEDPVPELPAGSEGEVHASESGEVEQAGEDPGGKGHPPKDV